MAASPSPSPAGTVLGDVFSLAEVARAAGVPVRQARVWARAEGISTHRDFVRGPDAVTLVRTLTGASIGSRRRPGLGLSR